MKLNGSRWSWAAGHTGNVDRKEKGQRMKINTLLQAWMIVVVSVLLAHAGFAQAPNGSISSPTFSGVQGIYDLTGVLTNLSVDFAASDGTPVPFNQDVSVEQSMTGVITATTTGTTSLVMAEDGTFSNAGTYSLKGTIRSSGSNVLFSLAYTYKSGAFLGGDPTYTNVVYTESFKSLATIDPLTGTMTGVQSGASSYRLGRKAGSSKISYPTFSGTVPDGFTPIDWQLSMILTSTVTKVAGTATVSLANDRSFPFTVSGATKDGASQLALTGTDTGKGGKLTVTMTGTNITGITGSLLGQKVDLSGL
jgi:hypothetical protein